MTAIADRLQGLRSSLPGCRLAAYGDLQSELVLLTSSSERRAREFLDTLSAEAARLFHAFDEAALPGSAEALAQSGLSVLLPGEVRLYMRGFEQDFLCLVSDTPNNSVASTEPASRFLASIVRGADV